MSVPKHRKTHSKTRMGRSHEAIKTQKANACANCGAPVPAHTACKACGQYKGKKVLSTKADLMLKRTEKRKKQEAKEKEKMAKLKNK